MATEVSVHGVTKTNKIMNFEAQTALFLWSNSFNIECFDALICYVRNMMTCLVPWNHYCLLLLNGCLAYTGYQ